MIEHLRVNSTVISKLKKHLNIKTLFVDLPLKMIIRHAQLNDHWIYFCWMCSLFYFMKKESYGY